MPPSSDAAGADHSGQGAPEPKRRKLRKGTQSCWECKRRKIRCTLTAHPDVICDSCKHRGSPCVSQEFPDNRRCSKQGEVGTTSRLDRVEALIEQLLKGPSAAKPASTNAGSLTRECDGQHVSCEVQHGSSLGAASNGPAGAQSTPRQPANAVASSLPSGKGADTYDSLVTEWPSQHELDLILSSQVRISGLAYGVIYRPICRPLRQKVPPARELLQRPPLGSHPILVARKLLICGTFLQAILLDSGHSRLHDTFGRTTSRVVNAASKILSSDDELVNSIEGIECTMIESNYYNNSGNLHRAWLAARRAMMVAQLMGLHRAPSSSALRVLEPETRACLDSEYMWFRLVLSDRYLSMMLDLPQGSLDDHFASPNALGGCAPMERLERMHCAAGGRILRRFDTGSQDLSTTKDIDKLLKHASACMPAQWWLAPSFSPTGDSSIEETNQTVRVMSQFTHHYLLVQLHLPYLLHYAAEDQHTYSKITAINASREILTRFISFRSTHPGSYYYCRGVDFLAFIASSVLCLAHIHVHSLRHGGTDDGNRSDLHFLEHQLLSDRGILEQTLRILENMARNGTDKIASQVVSILRPLLAIEVDAAQGGNYTTCSLPGNNDEQQARISHMSDCGHLLCIHVPYYGIIKVERSGIAKPPVPEQGESLPGALTSRNAAAYEQQPLTSVDLHTHHQIGHLSTTPVLQTAPSQPDHLIPPAQQLTAALGKNSQDNVSPQSSGNSAQDPNLFVPGVEAGVDDWALQGVDMAFIDNMISQSDFF